jgi:hypothetical protein
VRAFTGAGFDDNVDLFLFEAFDGFWNKWDTPFGGHLLS